MTTDISGNSYKILVDGIGSVPEQGRDKTIIKVNSILVETYWHVGQRIVEFKQAGKIKAEYGKELLLRLSKDLKIRYGKGFSKSNLQYMRLLYMAYPKRQTLSGKLSWSHYVELLSISDDAGRSFYEKQCIAENWSVRELKRQRNASLFERIALSRDKSKVAVLKSQGQVLETSKDIIKDPYVFELLDMPEKGFWSERSLENALVEYATGSISNQLFVSQYQLYLPDKKLLEEKLRLFMDEESMDDRDKR